MGLAYVIGPHVAVVAGRPDDLQKEWQECRSIIGRLDTTLVDLRKYGFGLASGLLTANGVLGGVTNFFRGVTVPSAVSAALVAVTMVLVTVLFVVDRYYSMLQWGAVNRARGLESALSLNVTSEMLRWAQGPVALESKSGPVKAVKWLWQRVALVQYGSFVIVAAVLGATIMARDAIPSTLMWLVCMVSIVLIGIVYWIAGEEWKALAQEPPRVVSTVSTFRGKLVNPTQLLANQSAEMAITLLDKEAALPQNSKVLAVVKPTVQNELTIVHCRIVETDIRITFSNPGSKTITPIADEEYEIFVY